MTTEEPHLLSPHGDPAAHGRLKIMVVILVASVLAMWGVVLGTALDMVNTGEVTPLTALLTLVSLVLAVVGALRRVLSGSNATVPFSLAAAGFAFASWQWGFPYTPGRVAAASALAAVAAVTLLRARPK